MRLIYGIAIVIALSAGCKSSKPSKKDTVTGTVELGGKPVKVLDCSVRKTDDGDEVVFRLEGDIAIRQTVDGLEVIAAGGPPDLVPCSERSYGHSGGTGDLEVRCGSWVIDLEFRCE